MLRRTVGIGGGLGDSREDFSGVEIFAGIEEALNDVDGGRVGGTICWRCAGIVVDTGKGR